MGSRDREALVPVLVYHRLAAKVDEASIEVPTVRVGDFERQIQHLVESGYGATSLRELTQSGGGQRERSIVITFDDGWGSTLTYALPILERHGLTATLFPTTDPRASVFARWRELDQPLGPDDWAALAAAGWEIGSHTCTHPPLVECRSDELMEELTSSRCAIEAAVGAKVEFLATPFGLSNWRVERAARSAGYRGMCPGSAGLCRWGQPAFQLRRVGVPTHISLPSYSQLLTSRGADIARLKSTAKKLVRRAIGHRNSMRLRAVLRRDRPRIGDRS